MSPWRRLTASPLVRFLALGVLLYAAAGTRRAGEDPAARRIVISAADVERLAQAFASERLRPPTGAELEGLVEELVREEICVREAKAMGLDRDDSAIRRHLRDKVEFLSADPEATYRDLLARTRVRVEWPAG